MPANRQSIHTPIGTAVISRRFLPGGRRNCGATRVRLELVDTNGKTYQDEYRDFPTMGEGDQAYFNLINHYEAEAKRLYREAWDKTYAARQARNEVAA